MGGGSWNASVYSSALGARKASSPTGSGFGYSDDTLARTPRDAWKAHDDLDPKDVKFRESRDSDEHPTSLAIAVLFDVTGSMGGVPRGLQKKLPELFGLLLRKGYVEHPQILFGAIGDATCDRIPLQVGQFESDNRLDENLANIALEGGGGGQMTESYELAMYFMLKHTAIDCFEKRGKRGYCFIIGDEAPYPNVKPREVADVIGDELTQPITTKTLVQDLQEMYDVYYIHPADASYQGTPEVTGTWKGLLGQQYVVLDDTDAVCETIALTIGLGEGTVDLDEGLDHLREIGSESVGAVGKALATVGSKGSIVESDGPADLGADGDSGPTRL